MDNNLIRINYKVRSKPLLRLKHRLASTEPRPCFDRTKAVLFGESCFSKGFYRIGSAFHRIGSAFYSNAPKGSVKG
ncbi:MAG: hypothetical protein RR339_13570, partial [Bacteroidales bacterium]